MKLYELKRGDMVYIGCSDNSRYVIFDHIDGMYSFCVSEKGNVVHLGASTEVEPSEDGHGYKVVREDDYVQHGRR